MNKVSVEYIIDDTSKEIYEFEKHDKHWVYVGIYYSHRDDKDDVWGDEWKDKYSTLEYVECNNLAESMGYDSYTDMLDDYDEWLPDDVDQINNKYNPVCQKTIHGKTYYSGRYWGYGSRDGKYTPKMSEEDIIKEITRQVSKVKIKL